METREAKWSRPDIRARLLAPCSSPTSRPTGVSLDVGALIRRLLLFETYVLESDRLAEVPHLLQTFGVDGLSALLESGSLHFQVGHIQAVGGKTHPAIPRPPNQYAVGFVRLADPQLEQEIHDSLQVVHQVPGLSQKRAIKLKGAISTRLNRSLPQSVLDEAAKQMHWELENNIADVKEATAFVLSEHLGRVVQPDEFRLRTDREESGYLVVDTDISSRLQITPERLDDLMYKALMGVGNVVLRIAYMRELNAISGIRDGELPVFGKKLEFLASQMSAEAQEARFQRVITIDGLPDPSEASKRIDVKRFLEVRSSPECIEFREWLRTLDVATDKEIRERVESLRIRVGGVLGSGPGRVMRFLTTSAIGAVPIVGSVLGAVASAIDSFVVERLFPKSGPVMFISRLYPSIFR